MAVGLRVWIGVNPNKDFFEDDFSDPSTVAPSEDVCLERINSSAINGLVPVSKVLILKGRISDR